MSTMATFVYLDETGSVGKGAKIQPYLCLFAVLVEETKVQPLAADVQAITMRHLGWFPRDFEAHGHEIWQAQAPWWKGKAPPELFAAYEDYISLVEAHDIGIVHSAIDKAKLHARYGGVMDGNAYVLALQFLLEKADSLPGLKIVIADESKEQQL